MNFKFSQIFFSPALTNSVNFCYKFGEKFAFELSQLVKRKSIKSENTDAEEIIEK